MADQVLQAPLKTDRAAMNWRTRLEGRTYKFRAMWNVRFRSWFLDISQSDGTRLLSAHRASVDVDILAPYNDARLPPGQLFFTDTQRLGAEATRFSLQGVTSLIYRPAADVTAAADTDLEVF